jgi:hypothetical protein
MVLNFHQVLQSNRKNNHIKKMENKKVNSLKLAVSVLMFAVIAIVVSSCKSNEDTFSAEDVATSSNEATAESQTSETDDIASSVLNSNDAVTGRVEAGVADIRIACANVAPTPGFTNTKEAGSITIDFGTTGCTDAAKNTRKGKIIVTWSGGRWFVAGATHTIKFSSYSINDVKFSDNDTRTVSNISTDSSPLTWTVAASHTLTYPDATTTTRTVNLTKKWTRTANVTDDSWTFSQTTGATVAAQGTNKKGKTYATTISIPLVYSRSCALSNKVFLPISGSKTIKVENKEIVFDYGTGTCDNTFTVTVNGKTKEIIAKNDGSGD